MKPAKLPLLFLFTVCIFAVSLAGNARAEMPMPNAAATFLYGPVETAFVSGDPASARPIGVGPDPRHQLVFTLGMDSFPGPVDVYLGYKAPAISQEIFLVTAGGGISPASVAITPFRAGVTGPLAEDLFGVIPLSALPSGDYFFFCLVTPAGTPIVGGMPAGGYYLWITSVTNLRAQDVTTVAINFFGDDATASAGILMALVRDYPLPNIVDAVMAGTLTKLGEIQGASSAAAQVRNRLQKELPDFCKDLTPEQCQLFFAQTAGDYLTAIANDENWGSTDFDNLATWLVLWAANQGYAASQIHEGVYGMIMGTRPAFIYDGARFTFRLTDDCTGNDPPEICTDGEKIVEPHVSPWDLFSDLNPDDFDSPPGLEGMTFPAYFKGTGSYREYYSNPNAGNIECSTESAVYVARVGGIGIWNGRVKVYAIGFPHHSSGVGKLECRTQTSAWTVAQGGYSDSGTYHDDPLTETFSGTVDILFNKDRLWGNYSSTERIPVMGGEQVTQKQWEFDLQPATEAEYNAVIGQ
jgi:hypothetical protein